VKTLTKIFGQKIDRIERPTSDDRHLGNGFGTPEFSASPLNLEFSHRLQRKRPLALAGWTSSPGHKRPFAQLPQTTNPAEAGLSSLLLLLGQL
jgi:hypothetical protein